MYYKIELPRYKCHKEVMAQRIARVLPDTKTGGAKLFLDWELNPEGPEFIEVNHTFMSKHNPVSGGYFIIYEDGYTSFSPAKAFEEGYTLCQ